MDIPCTFARRVLAGLPSGILVVEHDNGKPLTIKNTAIENPLSMEV
jgi:hypothetical protein